MVDHRRIPDADWRTIVGSVPLVSVDLVVEIGDGILLGKRRNEPAKDTWFVPGATVFKDEPRREAVHRVADEELGVEVSIVEELGTFEHFYDAAAVAGVDSKHYLATAYHVHPTTEEFVPDDQHSALEVFTSPPADAHPYVTPYFDVLS